MADRRTFKGWQRLHAVLTAPQISGKEFQALRRILAGFTSTEDMRKCLASRGLISSPYARRAIVTSLGHAAMEEYQRPELGVAPQKASAPKAHSPTERELWLAKFANNGNPRPGCHG